MYQISFNCFLEDFLGLKHTSTKAKKLIPVTLKLNGKCNGYHTSLQKSFL